MVKKLGLVLVVVTLAGFAGLIFIHKETRKDSYGSLLKAALFRNNYVKSTGEKQWAKGALLLSDPNFEDNLRQRLQIQQDGTAKDLDGLRGALVTVMKAYADGRFTTLKDYFTTQSPMVDSNAIAEKITLLSEALKTATRIDLPAIGHPTKAKKPTFVPLDSNLEAKLGLIYTNNLKIYMINDLAMESYTNVMASDTKEQTSEKIVQAINKSLQERLNEMDTTQEFYKFIKPWEQVSSQLLTLRIFSTNRVSEAWIYNRSLLQGPTRQGAEYFGFSAAARELAKQRAIDCAVFQSAIKPKNSDYFAPVTICFFYDGGKNKWLLQSIAVHAQIAPSLPLP